MKGAGVSGGRAAFGRCGWYVATEYWGPEDDEVHCFNPDHVISGGGRAVAPSPATGAVPPRCAAVARRNLGVAAGAEPGTRPGPDRVRQRSGQRAAPRRAGPVATTPAERRRPAPGLRRRADHARRPAETVAHGQVPAPASPRQGRRTGPGSGRWMRGRPGRGPTRAARAHPRRHPRRDRDPHPDRHLGAPRPAGQRGAGGSVPSRRDGAGGRGAGAVAAPHAPRRGDPADPARAGRATAARPRWSDTAPHDCALTSLQAPAPPRPAAAGQHRPDPARCGSCWSGPHRTATLRVTGFRHTIRLGQYGTETVPLGFLARLLAEHGLPWPGEPPGSPRIQTY